MKSVTKDPQTGRWKVRELPGRVFFVKASALKARRLHLVAGREAAMEAEGWTNPRKRDAQERGI